MLSTRSKELGRLIVLTIALLRSQPKTSSIGDKYIPWLPIPPFPNHLLHSTPYILSYFITTQALFY